MESVTPRWGHIIGHDTMNHKMAMTSLLGWPSRERLSDQLVQLFRGIKDVVRLHSSWCLRPPIDEDIAFSEDLQSAKRVFEAGRASISVIGGARIILEATGEQQCRQASDLLAKKGTTLPNSMAKALEKILSTWTT